MEFQKYLSFLTDLQKCLDSLTTLEQRKISAIQSMDFDALDQCIKQEQAAALDLRGREQKRAELLAQLELSGVSLRDLPEHCPAEYRGQAREVTQSVLSSYEVLASAQTASRTLMESNLRHIQHELDHRREPRRESSATRTAQTDLRV